MIRTRLFCPTACLTLLTLVPALAQEPAQAPRPLAANIVEDMQFSGARRIPQDTLRAMISSQIGDAYNENASRRDVATLWKMNRFGDITLSTARGERGGLIIRFAVVERPILRTATPSPTDPPSTKDILGRFSK